MALSNAIQSKFSIGDVVRTLEDTFPEVTPSALRFLEKEGLITPDRSPGGHRTFSSEDVEQIRTIKRWQRQHLTLDEIRNRLVTRVGDSELDEVVPLLVDDLQSGDIPASIDRISSLLESGTSLLALFDHLITPTLRSLADDWSNATNVDRQLEFDQAFTNLLARTIADRRRTDTDLVVLAATPTWERHDNALRMVLALLNERGAEVHYLGTGVEAQFLAHAAARIKPSLFLTSVTMPVPDDEARAWFDEIHADLATTVPVRVIGGTTAASIPSDIPQVVIPATSTFAETLDRLNDILQKA